MENEVNDGIVEEVLPTATLTVMAVVGHGSNLESLLCRATVDNARHRTVGRGMRPARV